MFGGLLESVAHHGRADGHVEQQKIAAQNVNCAGQVAAGCSGRSGNLCRHRYRPTHVLFEQAHVEEVDCDQIAQFGCVFLGHENSARNVRAVLT